MQNHVIFDERPNEMTYTPLPDGRADIWLRKNIREYAAEEGEDGETVTVIKWAADEAYMRTEMSREAVETDFDRAFEKAKIWRQGDAEKTMSELERIEALEMENEKLLRQLTDTQLALCELYESMI